MFSNFDTGQILSGEVCSAPNSVIAISGLNLEKPFKEVYTDLKNPETVELTRSVEQATFAVMKTKQPTLVNVRVTKLQSGSIKVYHVHN